MFVLEIKGLSYSELVNGIVNCKLGTLIKPIENCLLCKALVEYYHYEIILFVTIVMYFI